MKGLKLLFVFAHPDDELICGWPLLQEKELRGEILICSSDAHNPARKWCRHRKESLFALCAHLGLPCRCLDHDSEFSRTPHRPPRRRGGIRRLWPRKLPKTLLGEVGRGILEAVAASDCDAVFTHNFWGEYGHLDHMLLNSLIFNNTAKPVFMTDLRLPYDWIPLADGAPLQTALLRPYFHSTHSLDAAFYEECAAFYKKAGVWTWSSPPAASAAVYRFDPAPEAA